MSKKPEKPEPIKAQEKPVVSKPVVSKPPVIKKPVVSKPGKKEYTLIQLKNLSEWLASESVNIDCTHATMERYTGDVSDNYTYTIEIEFNQKR